MMPETNPGASEGWLPSLKATFYTPLDLLNGDYDSNGLRFNLKWNSHRDDPDLRAFLAVFACDGSG